MAIASVMRIRLSVHEEHEAGDEGERQHHRHPCHEQFRGFSHVPPKTGREQLYGAKSAADIFLRYAAEHPCSRELSPRSEQLRG